MVVVVVAYWNWLKRENGKQQRENNMENIYNTIAALTGSKAPNYDQENGYHYGVIPSRDLNQDALEDIYHNGTDLDWLEAVEEMKGTCTSLASRLLSDEAVTEALMSSP